MFTLSSKEGKVVGRSSLIDAVERIWLSLRGTVSKMILRVLSFEEMVLLKRSVLLEMPISKLCQFSGRKCKDQALLVSIRDYCIFFGVLPQLACRLFLSESSALV